MAHIALNEFATRTTATPSLRNCSATATDEATTGPTSFDMLTMHPDARRQVVRLLGEIQSSDDAS